MRSAHIRLLAAWLCLTLGSAAVSAQQSTSLSAPLSAPIGQSIYSENDLTGPSNTLIPGDNNLTNPYIRSGISDPLGFLIESNLMSPYTPEQSYSVSYPDTEVHSDLVNDSTVAARFSEYRDNRLLMSGAGASALRTGRASAAGATLARQAGASAGGAASSAFSRAGVLAPFAAGSSALASRQPAALGADPAFVDPNAVVATLSSSAALSGVSSPAGDAAAASGADTVMGGITSGVLDPNASTMSMSFSAIPLGALVPPATSLPYGPSPGGLFPNVSLATQSATGFPDSTMDTAGLPSQSEGNERSPLLSSFADSTSSPFKDLGSETTQFLTPTLLVGSDAAGTNAASAVPLAELKRQARLHAMIYNPGSPLPSPFEERAMEKAYLRQQRSQHQSHSPKLLAPSVTP